MLELEEAQKNPSVKTIFDLIMEKVQEAPNFPDEPFRMQVTNLGYDDFVGRLGIGRVYKGTAKAGQQVLIFDNMGKPRK